MSTLDDLRHAAATAKADGLDQWAELFDRAATALAARQDGVRNALHEIVTNGEHTPDGGWKVSAEVYQLAYDADLFSDVEQGGKT